MKTKKRKSYVRPLVAILFAVLFVGSFLIYAGVFQKNYANNVLGVSTFFCGGKFDLNCDTKVNTNDFRVLLAQSKTSTPPPTISETKTTEPTPHVMCGNGICDANESASSCSQDCGKGATFNTPTAVPQQATPTNAPNQKTNTTNINTPTSPTPTYPPPSGNEPYPNAPLCPPSAHTFSKIHGLWDPVLRCHYDHEHGDNPFTQEVAATFPGYNLLALTGGVGIGHTNPSGPMENTHKHGGFKWQVMTRTPNGCNLGFEDSDIAVNALAVQYHAFGNYSMEFESRIHSALALLRQCKPDSMDYGYIFTVQHIDYGQRVSGYQGDVIPYPDSPNPGYRSGLAPYNTIDCIGRGSPPCGRYSTYDAYVRANGNTSTTWTSGESFRLASSGSPLFTLLFRARDTYQILDWSDSTHPFKFLWMCSGDSGATFSQFPGCRHNNSTTRLHEVQGTIPAEWDNLAGFDTDSRQGRVTATGYTTRFGTLNRNCTTIGPDCHPIKLVNAYVGLYGSLLFDDKVPAFGRDVLPERDIYFCNGRACQETDAGSRSSGWIGPNN